MSLIYGEEADLHLPQMFDEAALAQTLGRYIEEFELASYGIVEYARYFLARHARYDARRLDMLIVESLHLVFHQRDEWRYYDARAFHQQSCHLKAKALPPACGEKSQGVAPFEYGIYDFFLLGTECIIAPILAK